MCPSVVLAGVGEGVWSATGTTVIASASATVISAPEQRVLHLLRQPQQREPLADVRGPAPSTQQTPRRAPSDHAVSMVFAS